MSNIAQQMSSIVFSWYTVYLKSIRTTVVGVKKTLVYDYTSLFPSQTSQGGTFNCPCAIHSQTKMLLESCTVQVLSTTLF